MMHALVDAYAFDIHVRRDLDEKYSAEGIKAIAHDITEGVAFQRSGVKVTAFVVDHAVVKPALGIELSMQDGLSSYPAILTSRKTWSGSRPAPTS